MAPGPHIPRRDGQHLHGQAEHPHLARQACTEGRDEGFGRCVHDLVGQANPAAGAEVHDERGTVATQRREQPAREAGHEARVQGDGAVDVGGRVRGQGLVGGCHGRKAPDVVEQHGDVQVLHRGERPVQRCGVVGDGVHDQDAHLRRGRLPLQGGLRGSELAGLVPEQDGVEAHRAERLRKAEPEAVAAAGDEGPGGGAVPVGQDRGGADIGVEKGGEAVKEVEGGEEAESVDG